MPTKSNESKQIFIARNKKLSANSSERHYFQCPDCAETFRYGINLWSHWRKEHHGN